MNKCPKCGHNCEGDFCWKHQNRKPMPKIGMKRKVIEDDSIDTIVIRNVFFETVWRERPHKSEISGEKILGEILSTYFHHILPKNKYPQAEYDKENVIILTFEEHQKAEQDMYFYEEINKRRIKLKEKYGL